MMAKLNKDIAVDVAIIGSGYTGLSTALHLARDHGIKATVLEANRTAWGASGRNGGFILKSSGRKPYATDASTMGRRSDARHLPRNVRGGRHSKKLN